MRLSELLDGLRQTRPFMKNVVAWQKIPAQSAQVVDLSRPLSPQLQKALQQRGIEHLFTHQAQAIECARMGENVVVATATASGKTLCYTIPVLEQLLQNPNGRSLYLFPTKALAHDQLAETTALVQAGDLKIGVHAYDGDTPQAQRRKARQGNGILITNPDMLHAGILPYHTSWRKLFQNLQFVVLDEIHAYRGVFGSHVANVIRRLRRLCNFYGSDPQFIACSATIANPQEHAQRLVAAPFTEITENGAPRGEKHFIVYNPPLIDAELGLRASAIISAKDAASTFLTHDIQTIVFARARQTMELVLTYLRDELVYEGHAPDVVTGYRGGYLPHERREIEQGLRTGEIRGVVATNALELGIDIGELETAVLTGYPGSIASTWQQAGRAGRRHAQSVALLIASNSPLDQYICNHPRYLFEQTPEHALINPDNLRIMVKHLQCSAFELPFQEGEPFGEHEDVDSLLTYLAGEGLLHQTRQNYHWLGEEPPSRRVSLRTSSDETVLIQMTPQTAVIGEVDLESAPMLVHEGAIYLHRASAYLVEELDWNGRLAHVRLIDTDYYTRASVQTTIRALHPHQEETEDNLIRAQGDVSILTQAVHYRKIKQYTHETLGFGDIDLPAMTLETTGYWLIFGEALTEQLYERGILLRPNNYGPNWQKQRQKALERDNHQCRTCGAESMPKRPLHVHHIRPFRDYNYIPNENENYLKANHIENLVTLCPSCHRRAEAGQQARSALGGLAYVLRNLAPLFLMCDPSDIEVSAEVRNPLTRAPTILIYERVAAGVGFSERLFALHDVLLSAALELVIDCTCRDGCPACIGPPGEIGPNTKQVTRQLLSILTQQKEHVT